MHSQKINLAPKNILFTLIALFATVFSIIYLDNWIAGFITNFLFSHHLLRNLANNIPDLLIYIVIISTILIWAFYFYYARRDDKTQKVIFLKLSGIIIPSSYIIKSLLKIFFRGEFFRVWVAHHSTLHHNLLLHNDLSSFPSGHMTVFAAFGQVLCLYYPQFRKYTLLVLSLLGISTIVTDYHFLSDVIAGFYFGVITARIISYFILKR